MTDRASQPSPGKRRFWRSVLLITGIVILLFVLAGVVFLRYTHTNVTEAVNLSKLATGYLRDKVEKKPPFHGRTHVNILFLGTDVNFVDAGPGNTDTIKLISLDLQKPALAILSVPRDTWVEIPGHGHGKINSAYAHGGPDELGRILFARDVIGGVLSNLACEDIAIPYYIRLQTGGMVKIVDALGGVEVNVEKQMDYDDNYQNLWIHLKPGPQVLNGHEAMEYVRFRHDAESDFGRMRRQDQFIHALIMEINKPEKRALLPKLIGPLMQMMKTNLSINDMLALKQVATNLGEHGILSVQLPVVPGWKGKASVVEVQDDDAAKNAIDAVLHGPKPSVVVLDGSGRALRRSARR